MDCRKIYIVQLHTNTLPARLIKFATNYPYSHVALSFSSDCKVIYSFGRKSLRNILNGGFVAERKASPCFEKFKNSVCRIYELTVTPEQYRNLRQFISETEKNSNSYQYDFLGAFLRFFKIPIVFKNKYVCSFFVAEALDKANIHTFQKENYFVIPKDFEALKGSRQIYEGPFLSNSIFSA